MGRPYEVVVCFGQWRVSQIEAEQEEKNNENMKKEEFLYLLESSLQFLVAKCQEFYTTGKTKTDIKITCISFCCCD